MFQVGYEVAGIGPHSVCLMPDQWGNKLDGMHLYSIYNMSKLQNSAIKNLRKLQIVTSKEETVRQLMES